jgi:hypothetical protein
MDATFHPRINAHPGDCTLTACPNCGEALIDGWHTADNLRLVTFLQPWPREDCEDFGVPVYEGERTVIVERSAFWTRRSLQQPVQT